MTLDYSICECGHGTNAHKDHTGDCWVCRYFSTLISTRVPCLSFRRKEQG